MFPLMLTVLNRDEKNKGGGTIIPIKDCCMRGEHPKGLSTWKVHATRKVDLLSSGNANHVEEFLAWI